MLVNPHLITDITGLTVSLIMDNTQSVPNYLNMYFVAQNYSFNLTHTIAIATLSWLIEYLILEINSALNYFYTRSLNTKLSSITR
jgi:hypothetical protein